MSVRTFCYLALWKRPSRAREIAALLDEERAGEAEQILSEASDWSNDELRAALERQLRAGNDPARERFGPALASVAPSLRRGLRQLSRTDHE